MEICARKKEVKIYCDCMYDGGCLWQLKELVKEQLLRRRRWNRDECVKWLKTHPKCSEKIDSITKPTDKSKRRKPTDKSKRRKQNDGVGGEGGGG